MCQQYLNGFGDLFEEEIRDLKKSSSRQTVWRFIDYMKYVCQTLDVKPYRRMAENGFAPPLGNFADISYLVEN